MTHTMDIPQDLLWDSIHNAIFFAAWKKFNQNNTKPRNPAIPEGAHHLQCVAGVDLIRRYATEAVAFLKQCRCRPIVSTRSLLRRPWPERKMELVVAYPLVQWHREGIEAKYMSVALAIEHGFVVWDESFLKIAEDALWRLWWNKILLPEPKDGIKAVPQELPAVRAIRE